MLFAPAKRKWSLKDCVVQGMIPTLQQSSRGQWKRMIEITVWHMRVPDLYDVMDAATRILIGDKEADVESILTNT